MLSRIKQNAIANLFGKLVLLAQQVILVPVFLWKWDAEYYGAWLVISAIPLTLNLANLGLGSAAAARIVLELGKGKVRDANSLLVNSFLGILGMLGGVVIVLYFIPEKFYAFGNDFPILNASPIICLLMLSVLLNSLQGPFEGFYVYKHKASLGINLRTVSSGFQVLAIVIALLLGSQAFGVALGICVASFVGTGLYILVISKYLEKPFNYDFSWWCYRELLGNGAGFQLGSLWQAIYFQGSIWTANALLGPAGAATWATLRILSRVGNQLIVLVNHSVKPELRTVVARHDFKRAQNLYSMASVITLALSLLVAVGLAVAGWYVYELWVGQKFNVPYAVWPLLGISLVLNALWWTSSIVYESLNKPWPLNICGVFSSIISVGVMAFVAHASKSIIAFPLGTIVFDGLMTLLIFRGSMQLLDDTWTGFSARAFIQIQELSEKLKRFFNAFLSRLRVQ